MTALAAVGASRRRAAGLFAVPLNVVADGNSIWADYLTEIGPFTEFLRLYAPASADLTTHNSAETDDTWTDMANQASSTVDAKWDPDRENVLIIQESVNTIRTSPVTPAEVIAQIQSYVNARLALHPWRIIFSTAPPFGGSPAEHEWNDTRIAINDHMLANYAGMGVERIVDTYQVPQFAHDGKSSNPFLQYARDWNETSNWVHPLDNPKVTWAQLIIDEISAMPPTP